jgi:parvulin-like peptidyl-prolyl isomerase
MRLVLVALGGVIALSATACGGGSSVPAGAVAVVNGTQVPRSALNEMMQREQAAYAAQNREFPKADSSDYRDIERNYLIYLVQQEEFRQQAAKLGVRVTQKDVDNALQSFIKSHFGGSRTKFRNYLAQHGYTEESFRGSLRSSLLTQKLLAAVSRQVQVDDSEVRAYYRQYRTSKYVHSSLAKVENAIRVTLLSQKRAEVKIAWVQNLPARYKDKVDYAKGLQPPGS